MTRVRFVGASPLEPIEAPALGLVESQPLGLVDASAPISLMIMALAMVSVYRMKPASDISTPWKTWAGLRMYTVEEM